MLRILVQPIIVSVLILEKLRFLNKSLTVTQNRVIHCNFTSNGCNFYL